MKIIVAIKQVPERDAQVRIDSSGKWIEEADVQFAMNESDAYALEEGLQLKEKHGGEVIVLSAGPERVGTTIREALAKGADRAIHVDADNLHTLDALAQLHNLTRSIGQRDRPLGQRIAISSGKQHHIAEVEHRRVDPDQDFPWPRPGIGRRKKAWS